MAKKNYSAKQIEAADILSTPDAKGKRLKRVRNLANLTREQLCDESDINIHTLIGWENGRFGGLTRVGAERLIKRLAQEGVQCTVEWLLHEIGAGPSVVTDLAAAKADFEKETSVGIPIHEEEKLIANELLLFRQQNQNTIDFIVNDDGMLPLYNLGDYVAGRKRYKNKIDTVTGMNCIVQTEEGKIFLRNLRRGPVEGHYNLVCSNPHTNVKDSVIYNVKLISAAPVIWHRKKDPN